MDHVLGDGVSLPSPLTITHATNLAPHTAPIVPTISLSNPDFLAAPSFTEQPLMLTPQAPIDAHDAIGVSAISIAPYSLTEPAKISEGTRQIAGHMTIDVVAAPGATFSSAASAALHYAAIYLGNMITDPIAVTIQANVSNLNTASATSILAYGSAKGYFENFNTVRNEIALHDPSVAKYLPTTLPSGVYSSIAASKSELKAWGIGYPGSYSIDGSIVINTAYSSSFNYSTGITAKNANAGLSDFVGVAEHELSHALGRISYNSNTASNGQYLFGPLNLFRFDSPGTLQVEGVSSSSNATVPYLSFNGGKSQLISFYNVSRSDWVNLSSGTRYSNDAWNGAAPSSGYARMYNLDRSLLNAIGFNVNCFAAGTRILLRRGEVAVENLVVGDEIILANGGTAPIRWIGQRTILLRNQPNKADLLPILIKAGALGPNMPARDLLVSPDHALFLDDHLIPAKALLNGHSIYRVNRDRITYYHIELPTHAILIAEGTPAESYLDTGNRDAFDNAGIAVSLHPDFAPLSTQTLREQQSCAPFVESGPVVEQIRARILARATIATTSDPEIATEQAADGSVILHSRAAIPGLLGPDPRDRRTLGVKIARITADNTDIPLDHPALTEGWHHVEPDGRWTNGRATIPASLVAGRDISIEIAASLAYPVAPMTAKKISSGARR